MSLRAPMLHLPLALLCSAGLLAADGPALHPDFIGDPVTPVSVDVDLRDLPPPRAWRPGDPIKEVPRRAYPRPDAPATPAGLVRGEDPLPKRQADWNSAQLGERVSAFGTPTANFAGAPYGAVNPPDTSGDVGPNHIVEGINRSADTVFYVYDKAGALLAGPVAMQSLSFGGNCTSGGGDPIILYDRFADRWIIQEFAVSGNHLCVYVSKTPNPVTGGWWAYDFITPQFPDYPHYGVWPEAYIAATNESAPAVYAFNRNNMLAGASSSFVRFTATALSGYTFQTLTPADFQGPTAPPSGARPVLARHHDDEAHGGSSASDFIDLFEIRPDWVTPANSALVTLPQITITDYNSKLLNYTTFSAISQPGSSGKLDPIREVILQKFNYRNHGSYESLTGNFVLNLNPSLTNNAQVSTGIRWFELRRSGVASPWALYQEGTWSNGQAMGTHSRWMGSLGADSMGNLALAYNKVDTAAAPALTYPSLYYTGRLAGDAPGVMSQGENLIIRGSAASGSTRWGDYAAGGIDPADDCTFWSFGEYNAAAQWSTRISAVKFDGCTCQLHGMTLGTLLLAKSGSALAASWGATDNALGKYRLYRSPNPNPVWTRIADNLTALSYSDAGQLPTTQSLFYSAVAFNPCGAETPLN